MAEDQKTPDQEAAEKAAAQAKAAADAAAAGSAPPEGKTAADLAVELANTQRALKDANKEAGDRRKRLKELEDAEEARKAASLSETEKLQKELEEARAETAKATANAREMLVRSAFVAEAAKAGVLHPEDVYLLADKAGVDVNEQGAVEGVEDAVKALVEAGRLPMAGKRPAPNLDGGAGDGDRTKDAVAKLTPDEIRTAKNLGISLEVYAKRKATPPESHLSKV